jgi:hypothetical protein
MMVGDILAIPAQFYLPSTMTVCRHGWVHVSA